MRWPGKAVLDLPSGPPPNANPRASVHSGGACHSSLGSEKQLRAALTHHSAEVPSWALVGRGPAPRRGAFPGLPRGPCPSPRPPVPALVRKPISRGAVPRACRPPRLSRLPGPERFSIPPPFLTLGLEVTCPRPRVGAPTATCGTLHSPARPARAEALLSRGPPCPRHPMNPCGMNECLRAGTWPHPHPIFRALPAAAGAGAPGLDSGRGWLPLPGAALS